jgi:hypothetical protein
MAGPSFIRTAHGTAAEGGAVLVAEAPPLDETPPLNATDTSHGLALRRVRGRPFQIGNTAASDRGPSLTRITCDPNAPEEQQRVHRKAATLKSKRERELSVQYGGPVSSAVKTELVAWARNVAWAEHFDRAGEPLKAAALAEKASGHQLKAIGIGERESKARPAVDPGRRFLEAFAGSEPEQEPPDEEEEPAEPA